MGLNKVNGSMFAIATVFPGISTGFNLKNTTRIQAGIETVTRIFNLKIETVIRTYTFSR